MVHLVLSGPTWFFGFDSMLEIIAGIIALLIVMASTRYARLAKDKRYGALGGGFLLIFLSFISQVVTSFFIYHELKEVALTDSVVDITNMLFIGHAAHVLFFISGLIVLVLWALKITERMQQALTIMLIFTLTIIGITNPFIYNFTALALLVFISAKFFLNAHEQQTPCSWAVLAGFALITLARLAFMLAPLDPYWYVGGHGAQLIGYLMLLGVLVKVLRK
jgi:hypothetical protein